MWFLPAYFTYGAEPKGPRPDQQHATWRLPSLLRHYLTFTARSTIGPSPCTTFTPSSATADAVTTSRLTPASAYCFITSAVGPSPPISKTENSILSGSRPYSLASA